MIDYTNCKLYGHHWTHYDVEQEGSQLFDIVLCANCTTVRRDKLVMSGPRAGKVYTRSYSYPKGYHRDKRERHDLRIASVSAEALA